jgi:hypothetical protein
MNVDLGEHADAPEECRWDDVPELSRFDNAHQRLN